MLLLRRADAQTGSLATNAILDLEWVKWAGNQTDLVNFFIRLLFIRLISNMVAFRPIIPSMMMVFDQNNIYSL